MKIKRPLFYFVNILFGLALALTACGQQSSNKTQEKLTQKSEGSVKISLMDSTTSTKDLHKLLCSLKTSMIAYMQTAEPSYTMDDIDSCEMILKAFLADMDASKNKEQGLKIVKRTILALNALNTKTDETLIETSEREQIAEIIILSASQRGYNSTHEDITEEWREW